MNKNSNTNPDESYAFTPEKILADGIDLTISVNPYTAESGPVRKGTVAATLNNIALLNSLLLNPTAENTKKSANIIEAISLLIPSLKVIGMFDFFNLQEWLSSENQPGRTLVGILALMRFPNLITADIQAQLEKILAQTSVKELKERIEKIVIRS